MFEEEKEKCEWPLVPERDIFMVRSLFAIQLPDEKHEDTVRLPEDGRLVYKTKYIFLDRAEKGVRKLNEWKRKRGGRKVDSNKPDPKEYLNHAV